MATDPVSGSSGEGAGGHDERVPVAVVREGGAAYERDVAGPWRRGIDGEPVPDATDLTLADLYDPPRAEVDGAAVCLVPRAWASRHPDHPLAWTFEHADLGGRGPIAVPAEAWDARADRVVAMASAVLHPWNLVGVDGVAGLLGVAESTVRAYLARRQMPEPIVRLGRAPVWSREQIEAWHATRARARPAPVPARSAPDDDDGEASHHGDGHEDDVPDGEGGDG